MSQDMTDMQRREKNGMKVFPYPPCRKDFLHFLDVQGLTGARLR